MSPALAPPIREFQVRNLHGSMDITVPIVDNRIVLVGHNGLGKSTFINLLYFFISRQWRRLLEYDFSQISVTIGDRQLRISKDEIQSYFFSSERLHLPTYVMRNLDTLRNTGELARFLSNQPFSYAEARRYSELLRIPRGMLEQIRKDFVGSISERQLLEAGSNIKSINDYLSENLPFQVLYLPTYRRIERDLGAIFPGLAEEINKYHDTQRRARVREEHFIELVEFGMEDVEEKIREVLQQLKDTSRAELNSLAGSYLRDVIRGEGQTYDQSVIASLTETDVDSILNRVEERTLNEQDKQHLREFIEKIKGTGTRITVPDKYIAHFFSKLVGLSNTFREKEVPITRFAEVSNKYLVGKKVIYDERAYSLVVRRERNNQDLELRMLSSGEKQIISLFSQLYLSQGGSYIILIDEPELSLSVVWQKTFLPDILASGHSAFLAAVTHSPFIFENELESHTRDLADCVRENE